MLAKLALTSLLPDKVSGASAKGDFVTVTPASCVFSTVDANVRHVLTISVRNTSSRGRRPEEGP